MKTGREHENPREIGSLALQRAAFIISGDMPAPGAHCWRSNEVKMNVSRFREVSDGSLRLRAMSQVATRALSGCASGNTTASTLSVLCLWQDGKLRIISRILTIGINGIVHTIVTTGPVVQLGLFQRNVRSGKKIKTIERHLGAVTARARRG